MALRDILLRMLSSRKWEAFAEPVSPDEDPHYWDTVCALACGGYHTKPLSRIAALRLTCSMGCLDPPITPW